MAFGQQSLVRVIGNEQLIAQEQAAIEAAQNQPIIQSLASHVRRCFNAAQTARMTHEEDLLAALRARNGEYDPGVLAEIKKQGGSEVYARVTSTKMRGAQSWLKDIYLNIDRPWTFDPTPIPELQQKIEPLVMMQLDAYARQAAQMGVMITEQELMQAYEMLLAKAQGDVSEQARELAQKAEDRINDTLVEGGFYTALDKLLSDITTFKIAVLKGPVVRMRRRLQWQDSPVTGQRQPAVVREPIHTFNRVSPLAIYPAPNIESPTDGYIIERHKLYRQDLVDLIGTPGFDEQAIRQVLDDYGRGGLNEWLSVDSAEAQALNSMTSPAYDQTAPTIDALEYWGSVQGAMLIEWGMQDPLIDSAMEYQANVWVIGAHVIKAVINHDPLGRIPYSITSYAKVPGTIWGEGLNEQLRDIQQVCSAALRSLTNNMALSSGPQVGVNISRMPPGEDITTMFPWKIWQFVNDPSGQSTAKPIEFFQPESHAQQLVGVYEKFSQLADEWSNIPRYMMGDQNVGGAGRTAAGLSMLMNAANKGVKNVANNIDTDIIVPTIERLYYSMMLNDPDASFKGDVQIRARGASGLLLKELLNQRRLEFLQLTTNPVDLQIVNPLGRASILREIAKGLEMNTDDIVPDDDMLQQRMMMGAGASPGGPAGAPPGGPAGAPPGAAPQQQSAPSNPRTVDQDMRRLTTGPKPGNQ